MDDWLKVYFAVLLGVLVLGFGYYTMPAVMYNPDSTSHYIGVNLTKHDGKCRVTWLGGWDFDSFYTNVTVNGVNKGHPLPRTVIYDDICQNITVKMHDKAVHTDMPLYQYNHTGEQ